MVATIHATAASCTVFGSASMMVSRTDRCVAMLSPMSPRNMFPSQTAYWTTTGRSNPHLARSSRTVCSASP